MVIVSFRDAIGVGTRVAFVRAGDNEFFLMDI
jgi:hypothetical protein